MSIIISKGIFKLQNKLFDGPHPSGNVGVQIHHINPINSGEVVWVEIRRCCSIRKFCLKGEYLPNRTIAISGPPVENPKYLLTRTGVELKIN